MARFLVIDDDATVREMIVLTLESAGHTVATAACGQESVTRFEENRPDIVVTDLLMPRNSITSVIGLRQRFPETPFILISGVAAQSPESTGVTAILKPRYTLQKPFSLGELMHAIDQILHEQKLPIPPRWDNVKPRSS